jgi:hypothetical protein
MQANQNMKNIRLHKAQMLIVRDWHNISAAA